MATSDCRGLVGGRLFADHRAKSAAEGDAIDVLRGAAQLVEMIGVVLVPNLRQRSIGGVVKVLDLVAALDFDHNADAPRAGAGSER